MLLDRRGRVVAATRRDSVDDLYVAWHRKILPLIAESRESGEVEAAVIERILPSVDGVILATSREPS